MTIQILLIAILSYMGSIGAPFFFGTTGGFYTLGRPLIASALVGLILGDMQTALAIGIALQAMYIGVVTPGGAMPFDVDYVGYLTPALIILAKSDPALAASLAVPVGLVGVLLWNITYVSNVVFVRYADKQAEAGSTKGIKIANLIPQVWCFIIRVLPAILILTYGSDFLQVFVSNLPQQITQILTVLSAILPALGIGILLNMLIKEKLFIGIYLVGFVLTVYLKLPIMAIAIIGTVLALFYYRNASSKQVDDDDDDDEEVVEPVITHTLLSKKVLNKTWLTWMWFNGPSQSGERMQGIAFAHSMTPAIEVLYKDKEERACALKRHTTLFNVEPQLGAIVPGIVVAMEEQRASGAEIDDDTINTVKIALMGPLSGIGDTIIVGTLIPILLAICISITESSGIVGPIVYALVYIVGTFAYSYYLFNKGYKTGLNGIQSIISGGNLNAMTSALNILGLLVIGALTATYINVTTPLAFIDGEMNLSLQSILDSILPGILSLGFVALVYWLLAKKKLTATKVIFVLFIISVVGVFIGVL